MKRHTQLKPIFVSMLTVCLTLSMTSLCGAQAFVKKKNIANSTANGDYRPPGVWPGRAPGSIKVTELQETWVESPRSQVVILRYSTIPDGMQGVHPLMGGAPLQMGGGLYFYDYSGSSDGSVRVYSYNDYDIDYDIKYNNYYETNNNYKVKYNYGGYHGGGSYRPYKPRPSGPPPGYSKPGFNNPGPPPGKVPPGYSRPGFNKQTPPGKARPGFDYNGPPSGSNKPGPPSGHNKPGPPPGYHKPGPPPGNNRPPGPSANKPSPSGGGFKAAPIRYAPNFR